MKLLVDMFPCQTPSRFRGIGRYTLSLTLAMAKLHGINDLTLLADALYPESFNELRKQFVHLLPSGSFLPYYHESLKEASKQNLESYTKIVETLIEQAYQAISPDVILTPSLFDGWGGGEHGMVRLPTQENPFYKRAVILYDIIPYIFQKQYLDPDPAIKKWYLERIDLLKNFDLLLAISESSRQDAINILGLNPDRIVNISSAASWHFRKLELTEDEKHEYLNRFGITRPFVMYVGGNDFRKNMDGALRAFAELPRQSIARHQLVLNDVGDEAVFRNKARRLGLDDTDVVILRRTTDQELVALYNLCKLFIFPSLYEGFGLPILEAMSCGAPVIASNNSSLPEVVGRFDALFDATNVDSVSEMMNKALTDDAFRTDLASYGLERVKQFSWENSARRAWDAIETLIPAKNKVNNTRLSSPDSPQMHVAYVSPLPPQKSGIADYSAALLPYLADHFEVDLFVEPGLDVSDAYLKENFLIFPWTKLIEYREKYDAVIYHMGNSQFHIQILDLLREIPGIVVNHDFYSSNLPFVEELGAGKRGVFVNEMDYSHGLRGVVDSIKHGIDAARWKWPINWKVLRSAQELIVHSEHQKALINEFYGNGWKPSPTVIHQIRESIPPTTIIQKQALRCELGIDPDAFVYCSFGFMAPTKLNNQTIKAFSQALTELRENTMLIFVGDLEGGDYGVETINLIQELSLSKNVIITGYVARDKYEKYLACADVAIQLRTDSRGETSRAVLDCMAYGLPTIVNAHGSFNDYSDNDVIKLPDSPSLEEMTQAIVRIQVDNEFRMEKGRRAWEYIAEQHDPRKVAAEYADVVIRAAQANERRVFAPLVKSLIDLGAPTTLLQSSARYAAANLNLRCQPRILIYFASPEGVEVQNEGHQTALEIIKQLFSASDKSIHMEMVYFSNERLLRAGQLVEGIFELPKHSLGVDKPLTIQPGDILLAFNSLFSEPNQSQEVFETIRQRGGKIIAWVNDASEMETTTLVAESDIVLCWSQEVAKSINTFIEEREVKFPRPLDIFYLPSIISTKAKQCIDRKKGRENQMDLKSSSDYSVWNEIVGWILKAPVADQVFNRFSSDSTEEVPLISKDIVTLPKKDISIATPDNSGETITLLRSCVCSQSMLETDDFQMWVERMKGKKLWMHRKLWEWSYIAQALSERGMLKSGVRGLGFAVGQEPLPALFASYGCYIVATDLQSEKTNQKDWIETNQHASELGELNKAKICPDHLFEQHVSFRFVDMNQIDEDLREFDFLWSSCSLEHLGSLERGKQFIYNSIKCLKPGGIAVHTTEYNISSDNETLEDEHNVIYRKRDIEEISYNLRSEGHKIELDFTLGNKPFDLQVDIPPYKQDVHLRLELAGYVCTSYGLIIQKAF